MRETYKIEGMTCEGCVRSVTKAVQSSLPNTRIDVNLEAGTVTVDGPHEKEQVQRAVEDAGFDFAG